MARAKPRFQTITGGLEEAISYLNELEELQNEVQEIVDNASGTGLENTQRIQTLSDTADQLGGIDFSPDVPDSLSDVEFNWTQQVAGSRGLSRAARRDNAISPIQCAVDELGEIADEQEPERGDFSSDEEWEKAKEEYHSDDASARRDDADGLRDTLQEIIDTAEGVEFPGMYG